MKGVLDARVHIAVYLGLRVRQFTIEGVMIRTDRLTLIPYLKSSA